MIEKHWKAIPAITLLLFFGVPLTSCSTSKQSVETRAVAAGGITSEPAGIQVGNPAPDFQLAKMDGGPVSLAAMRGKPVVIVFWTAWCPVCKEEAPRINSLAAEYEGKGVRVLGINVKDSLARTEGGIKEHGIRYSVARDPDASVARAYKVMGTPTIVFMDRKGVVRYIDNELPSDYGRRLDSLLAENF